MNKINYKGKGEHSVRELEKIIEQREEELHLIRSGQANKMSTDNTKKELTAVNSKVEQHKLIGKHIGTMWGGLAQSSIEHFIQSGKVSGSFLIALENMMQEYASQQSDCLIDKNRLLLLNLSDILERNESMAEELERVKEQNKRMYDCLKQWQDYSFDVMVPEPNDETDSIIEELKHLQQ